jgi:hypothetical protein
MEINLATYQSHSVVVDWPLLMKVSRSRWRSYTDYLGINAKNERSYRCVNNTAESYKCFKNRFIDCDIV